VWSWTCKSQYCFNPVVSWQCEQSALPAQSNADCKAASVCATAHAACTQICAMSRVLAIILLCHSCRKLSGSCMASQITFLQSCYIPSGARVYFSKVSADLLVLSCAGVRYLIRSWMRWRLRLSRRRPSTPGSRTR